MSRSAGLVSAFAGVALDVEAQAVAVERDRLVQIADDRAEEIARAHDETGRRRTGRRCGGGLRVCGRLRA
jgi:hypothetical protein